MASSESSSLWLPSPPHTTHASLVRELDVDVAIIGAGITGITAGLLLARAGKRVAILESRRIASGVTGFTTAHLTQAVDARYKVVASRFGAEGASSVADSTRAAIARIEGFVRDLGIDCDFERVPGYLYSEREDDLEALHDEHHAANDAGVSVTMVRDVPLPFAAAAAVRFEDQAQFHIGKYITAMADAAAKAGCHIFEESAVTAIEEGETCVLTTAGGRVAAKFVISATDSPLTRTFVQTKIHSYRSYVLAFRPRAPLARALFWDTDDPYHYTRSVDVDGVSYVLVGGEDHKTGQLEDTEACFARLHEYARARFAFDAVDARWSSQVVEPIDGLPYIGPTPHAPNLLVATGYSGTGMTFGTLAADILVDRILGRENAWSELYAATRVKLVTAAHYVAENVDVAKYMVGDHLRGGNAASIGDVGRGEGKIVTFDGKKLAVYRDDDGAVHACSAVCPHLGCIVHFNAAETTWDCPCHGSRFATDGAVLHGPSLTGLAAADAEETSTPTQRAPEGPLDDGFALVLEGER